MKKYQLILTTFITLSALAFPTSVSLGSTSREKCQVHGEVLKKVKVPIRYGLIFNFVEPEARRVLFPNANTEALGGCEVEGGDPTEAEVYYCQKCRLAESKYKKEYGERCNRSEKCPERGWWRKRAA